MVTFENPSIKSWALMCGFERESFRDWSDFAKYVDDNAGDAVLHLRQSRRGRAKLAALPEPRKASRQSRARSHPLSRQSSKADSHRLDPWHTITWEPGGAPLNDFSKPRPQSQPSQARLHLTGSRSGSKESDMQRPGTTPVSVSKGPKERGQKLLTPMPLVNSPAVHRHTVAAKNLLETLPAIEGLDSESPVVTMSSKGPQLFQLAHELRMPAEVARQASDLFLRHSEGEGNDLFQRRLRMSNFTSLLQEVTHVSSISDLSPHFVETASRSLNRLNADTIDVTDFFIWYSAFSFSEEMTPNKDDHCTRRLAKKLGLEVVDVDEYRKAFKKFDTDGSGAIEIDEFQEILKDLLKLPPETELEPNRVANLFLIADTNHDGEVDFEEFCVFWSQSYGSGDNSQGLENLFASVYRSLRRVPAFT